MLLRSRTHFLSANLFTALCTVLVIHPICTAQNIPIGGMDQGLGINPGQQAGEIFTGTGISSVYGVNLVPFGPDVGDQQVLPGMLTGGQTIDLHMYFPFYGGLYNYSVLSVNGYITFATVLDQGPTINVGVENTDWPQQQDPAMIAPYLCKQQIIQNPSPGMRAGVFYRLVLRQSLFGRGSYSNTGYGASMQQSSFFGQKACDACPSTSDAYVHCDQQGDYFLDEMMKWLQEGVAGAAAFRADAALVVTWYNTASAISGQSDIDSGKLATYQVIWLTDQPGRLSYVILNYDKLGFDAADFRGSSRSGRCQALFNGGNHTGTVPVDPTFMYKNTPKVLAQRSGVPHIVRGRYMFRVDDVVRPAGCSNKTGGTFPMLIYPNIVNMLGEITVDVNAICLDRSQTYVLMIEQRQTASCDVLNAAIARCRLPKIYDWGTKTVYFQPQSGTGAEEKAFVGYMYFVPPTLDPMRIDIGNIYDWFRNPIQETTMPLSWYPRNFTNPDYLVTDHSIRISDDALYSVQLGLYVIGYTEANDPQIKKFRPEHRTLCRLATYSNRNTPEYRFKPQEERINLNQVERWYLTEWERENTLYTFRFGYLKLAPVKSNDNVEQDVGSGLVSAPISLHWLWTVNNPEFSRKYSKDDPNARREYVAEKSAEMCRDWYNEDGALWNFIRDTETNASCPCVERQAQVDLGRFMPHPRCSQVFRDITCTSMIGAKNCYMSSENIYGSYAGDGANPSGEKTARFPTHYGQVCCYDSEGKLMQTSYQPVIKVVEDTPYNPGFPLRAYEFGTSPYMGQFEVPGLSAFHNDYMPYFLCCKYANFRCQLFYWRRPSSGCQQYQPPAVGEGQGAGSFTTIDNDKFIFNEPGVYTMLYIPQTLTNPEVRIQIRLERYPNRKVDFSLLGRYIGQADLVQPTNATVITGIALEATGTDRVNVVVRKDTRRFRYRTSVIVGNILRYFDTMSIQRFKGVLVYVNNVERGQPEVYVVLEEAQIGVRIRESYALDIDRLQNYQESMGLLDVLLSVPPHYGVRPDGDKTREQEQRRLYNLPRVSGLMRPFPDQTSSSYLLGLTLNDVNSETIRQQIITNYRIPGSGEPGSDQNIAGTVNNNIPMDNMFTTSRDEDKKFEVFPEASMKSGPVYKAAEKYEIGSCRFVAQTGQMLNQLLMTCRDLQQDNQINKQPMQSAAIQRYGVNQCPHNPAQIVQECGDSVPCLYDYSMLDSRILGMEASNSWNAFTLDRSQASRHYNSCGPINIEYPEYLMKTPSLASGYLEGDVARFDCFQSHWIKGDNEYKCSLIVDQNHPDDYRFEWNKGSQPWCRSREKDNLFKWLAAIFGVLGILGLIACLFLCCWCLKQKRRKVAEEKASRRLSYVDEKTPMRADTTYDTRAFSKSKAESLNSLSNRGSLREAEVYRKDQGSGKNYRADYRDAMEEDGNVQAMTNVRSAPNLAEGIDYSSGAGFTTGTEYGGSLGYPPPPPPNYASSLDYMTGDSYHGGADFSAAAGAGNAGGVYRETVTAAAAAPTKTTTTTVTTTTRKGRHGGGNMYAESASAANVQLQNQLLGLNTSV
uniref:Protein mesh n=1 Tax=Ascaris suum TaxID=6253 RepID=F1KR18_ASCSU